MNIELFNGEYNVKPSVRNHGGHRVGNKTHKTWGVRVDGSTYELLRQNDRVAFVEYLASDIAKSRLATRHDTGFEYWLTCCVTGLIAERKIDEANAMFTIIEGHKFV